jgi:hypothetical protein
MKLLGTISGDFDVTDQLWSDFCIRTQKDTKMISVSMTEQSAQAPQWRGLYICQHDWTVSTGATMEGTLYLSVWLNSQHRRHNGGDSISVSMTEQSAQTPQWRGLYICQYDWTVSTGTKMEGALWLFQSFVMSYFIVRILWWIILFLSSPLYWTKPRATINPLKNSGHYMNHLL